MRPTPTATTTSVVPLKKSPPGSPPLEVTSPLPKPTQLSTASNSVFEQFKKQALENKERVCVVTSVVARHLISLSLSQDRLAKQQEEQRREQRRQAGLEAQRRREEQNRCSPSQQQPSPPATPSPAGSVEDSETKMKQRERQREEQRRKREAVSAVFTSDSGYLSQDPDPL